MAEKELHSKRIGEATPVSAQALQVTIPMGQIKRAKGLAVWKLILRNTNS